MLDKIKKFIDEVYPEDIINNMLDDQVYHGGWVSEEDMEELGFEDEWETYLEIGRGEAEDWVKDCVLEDIKRRWKLSEGIEENILEYLEETYENLMIIY